MIVFRSPVHPQPLVFGEVNCMAPNDIRQYLYNLRARPELAADIRQFKSNTLVGKLDIVWKTNLGERGRLQTSPLQRIVSVAMLNIPTNLFCQSLLHLALPIMNRMCQ
jgi:trafficking protein particle complex subunit 13